MSPRGEGVTQGKGKGSPRTGAYTFFGLSNWFWVWTSGILAQIIFLSSSATWLCGSGCGVSCNHLVPAEERLSKNDAGRETSRVREHE